MQITVCIRRTVIIDDDVHSLHINTTTKNISSDQNAFLESFEGGVSADAIDERNLRGSSSKKKMHAPFFLLKTGMDADTRKIAGDKEFVQFDSSSDRFYEDNNLEGEKILMKRKHQSCTDHTWLNSKESSNSFNFLFFPTSSSFT